MNLQEDAIAKLRAAISERLLITGATGFLGGAVTAQLIAYGYVSQLYFLVRARCPEQGLERLRTNLKLHGVGEVGQMALKSEQIICGDLLDTSWLGRESKRLMTIDRVLNCAAMASFSKNSNIWPVNVEGTFAFAKAMSRMPRLKRFVHVGTAMSCGPDCDSLVGESWSFPQTEDQLVPYTASKAEIERRMRQELPDLPLVVARPSIVVGHSKLGCRPSGSIFWMFRMGLALESYTCDLDEKIDVIPVDYCADALINLTLKRYLKHDLYHISAGSEGACTFAEIDQAFAAACSTPPVGGRYQKIAVEDLPTLAADFESKVGPGNSRLIMRALRLYSSFANLAYVFDNGRLLDEGIPNPPRFIDYLEVCVRSSRGVAITEQMKCDFK